MAQTPEFTCAPRGFNPLRYWVLKALFDEHGYVSPYTHHTYGALS